MKKDKPEIIKYDSTTKKWFDSLPITTRLTIQTTVMQCEECGLWYKPSLGHTCKKRKVI